MKPLTIPQINQMRVLLNKARKPAPMTREQANAKRNAKRAAYKAEVLAWAQACWDQRKAASVAEYGAHCIIEFAIGFRPTEYTCSLGERFKRRNQSTY